MKLNPKNNKSLNIDIIYLGRVLGIVRNLIEYGCYKKNPKNATNSLRKNYPKMTKEDFIEDIQNMIFVYQETKLFVHKNSFKYYNSYNILLKNEVDKKALLFYKQMEVKLQKKFEIYPIEFFEMLIPWIFYWHHLR